MARAQHAGRKPHAPRKSSSGALSADVLTAGVLSPLVNGYKILSGPQKAITVSHASQLATLQDVTVRGTLLKKQLVRLTSPDQRKIRLAANAGAYTIEGDGDLHFDLGV